MEMQKLRKLKVKGGKARKTTRSRRSLRMSFSFATEYARTPENGLCKTGLENMCTDKLRVRRQR